STAYGILMKITPHAKDTMAGYSIRPACQAHKVLQKFNVALQTDTLRLSTKPATMPELCRYDALR
ncbi:MAG: hypothetical protein ACYCUV_03230, partial [Phycisphaerae bacterium]